MLRRVAILACLALVALSACTRGRGAAAGPFPRFAEYEGEEVKRVRFVGELLLPRDSLEAITLIRTTRCQIAFLPSFLCFVGKDRYRLELRELARDVVRLQLYYRDHGYYGTQVVPAVEPLSADEDNGGDDGVEVRFAIAPGDRVILQELAVEGAEEIVPPERLLPGLPLAVGRPFRRTAFLSTADSIRVALQRRGYAYADVLRNYSLDTIADVAQASFIALPGPQVYVDTVVILGAERLERETVLRQLAVAEGEILQVPELDRSQRNLYALNMVNYATVGLAPDSLQVSQDSTQATVLVRVVESAQYVVDASVGLGTLDCLRSGARWTDRNFLGGGRRLEVSGNVSKIGVGEPTDWGLSSFPCGALQDDRFSRQLNYRVAADFEQPRLFATQTRLTANLHAERFSEVGAFLRESVGGQLSATREISRRALATLTADVERGSTEANEVIFCATLLVCAPEDREQLQDSRWSNSLILSSVFDRTGPPRSFGYVLRGNVAWASDLIFSDDEYLRLIGEASAYRRVRPGWTLAGNLRVGDFLQGSLRPGGSFVPPERRFFAGGPNSVRGFARNGLGPQAYVVESDTVVDLALLRQRAAEGDVDGFERAATGGTRTLAASVELRVPSPFLSDFTRLAAFVDIGQVWAPDSDLVPGPESRDVSLLATPGVGLRFITPVGPIRVDIGYNPHGEGIGPLFLAEQGRDDLILIDPQFEPETGSFFDRLQFHFAVGQAF